jgi:hypothetical protein
MIIMVAIHARYTNFVFPECSVKVVYHNRSSEKVD